MQLSLAADRPAGDHRRRRVGAFGMAAPLAPIPTALVSLAPANLTARVIWFHLQQNMPLNLPLTPCHPALRAGSWIKGAAKAAGIPVYSLKAASLSNLVR